MLFFVAVVLVIVGTYCLFTAGSVAILKTLKKNRKFYYKPGNFTAVSGLIYRMKQNAVGLCQHLHPVHHGSRHGIRDGQPLCGYE